MRLWEQSGIVGCVAIVALLVLVGLTQIPPAYGVPLGVGLLVAGAYLVGRRDDALRAEAFARGRSVGLSDATWLGDESDP